jgi:very-short-patch-repair endonuclease
MNNPCRICKKTPVSGKHLVCAPCLFKKHLRELNLCWQSEVKFHQLRKWQFDFVLGQDGEPLHIAVEIEGGIWAAGRHTRGAGYQKDLDKYNAATIRGWRVLRFSTEDIMRGRAKAFLAEHIGKEAS